MKKLIWVLSISIILFTPIFAQNSTNSNSGTQKDIVLDNSVYQMFPTQNYWTFIKLDTRNGKLWQVHFSIRDKGESGTYVINSTRLIDKEDEVNGRFTLYPTNNIYNFLLLDQISGKVHQVQWSMDDDYRGIFRIY